jgi:hypothetical protein
VWHASTSMLPEWPDAPDFLRTCAMDALQSVGDASLGEWEQYRNQTYHVRRRLTPEEQRKVGNAKDIRGTAEAVRRQAAMRPFLPVHMQNWTE